MTKDEAIKYLRQLYPNGGNTWLDEQRIEAISLAIEALETATVGYSEEQLKDALKTALSVGGALALESFKDSLFNDDEESITHEVFDIRIDQAITYVLLYEEKNKGE